MKILPISNTLNTVNNKTINFGNKTVQPLDTIEINNTASTVEKAKQFLKQPENLQKIQNYMEHTEVFNEESKNPLVKVLSNIYSKATLPFILNDSKDANTLIIETKDTKLGKQVLELNTFFSKMIGVNKLMSSVSDEVPRIFSTDTKTLYTEGTNDGFQSVISTVLKQDGERFKKDGTKTFLIIDDMEKLVNPETNSTKNIAMMKSILQKTDKEYGTQIQYIVSNIENVDTGIKSSNRASYIANLDGITSEHINNIKQHENTLQPVLDGLDSIFKKEDQTVSSPLKEKCNTFIDKIKQYKTIGIGIVSTITILLLSGKLFNHFKNKENKL